jgi:glycosyltransferase involved in cell wall biosynthesis
MPSIALLQTAPEQPPGSMVAYGRLVEQAVGAISGEAVRLIHVPLYNSRKTCGMWGHHFWRLRHAGGVLDQCDADFMHLLDGSMAAFIPRRYWGRLFITVHDLIPLLQWREEVPGPKPSWPGRWIVRRSLDVICSCRAVCAVSESTKADVARLTGRHDVAVIPHAVRPLEDVARDGALPEKFIFHIGNNAAYKNRLGAIKVFKALRREHNFKELHLMMAGPEPDAELRGEAKDVEGVRFMVDINDRTLSALYRQAALMIFPSYYEGYGMPVAEAMAAGCPVVCSDAPALVEVAGNAALTANADAVEMLAGCCRQILTDDALRLALVARGRARVASHSLENMGNRLVDWYKANR